MSKDDRIFTPLITVPIATVAPIMIINKLAPAIPNVGNKAIIASVCTAGLVSLASSYIPDATDSQLSFINAIGAGVFNGVFYFNSINGNLADIRDPVTGLSVVGGALVAGLSSYAINSALKKPGIEKDTSKHHLKNNVKLNLINSSSKKLQGNVSHFS